MRLLGLVLLFVVSSCGGPDDFTGACNICPSFKSVNTDECAKQGATAGCAAASIQMVTDDHCSVGKPVTTHPACVYSGCHQEISCDKIATF